ncbi:MAG: hypothetical protein GY710_12985 [Desulfobacteraceae bacterium]|nr:hypothetical protein [Desulfobacteraceae bacterium]
MIQLHQIQIINNITRFYLHGITTIKNILVQITVTETIICIENNNVFAGT